MDNEYQMNRMEREHEVAVEYQTGEREYPVTKKKEIDESCDTLEEYNS